MGKTLARKYKHAVAERNIQSEGHRGFMASLKEADVKKWDLMCVNWEHDQALPKKTPYPYHIASLCEVYHLFNSCFHYQWTLLPDMTEVQVQRELAEDQGCRLQSGGVSLNETTPALFLVSGLELEEMQ